MPKIPECDRCLLYSPSPYIVCGVHPEGVEGSNCIDFRADQKKEPEEKKYSFAMLKEHREKKKLER